MQNGQLIFVILFILAITIFSFVREKKKKPSVLMLHFPYSNQQQLLDQLKIIAGYKWEFVIEKSNIKDKLSDIKQYDGILKKIRPRVVFYFLSSTSSNENGVTIFELFCRKYALSLIERHCSLIVILDWDQAAEMVFYKKMLHEFALPFIPLREILDPEKPHMDQNILVKEAITRMAGRLVAELDKLG